MSGFLKTMFGVGDSQEPAPHNPPKQQIPEDLPPPSSLEENPKEIEKKETQEESAAPVPLNTSNPKLYAAPLDISPSSPSTQPAPKAKRRQIAKRPGQHPSPVPAPVLSQPEPEPQAIVPPAASLETPAVPSPPPEAEPPSVSAPNDAIKAPPAPSWKAGPPIATPEAPSTRTESPTPKHAPAEPTQPTVSPPARTRKTRAVRPGQGVTTVAVEEPSQEASNYNRSETTESPHHERVKKPQAPPVAPAESENEEQKSSTQKPEPAQSKPEPVQVQQPQPTHTRKAPTRQPKGPVELDEVQIEAALEKFVPLPQEHDSEALKQFDLKQSKLGEEKQSVLRQLAALEEQKKELQASQAAAAEEGNYEEAEKIDESLNDLRLFGKELHQQSIDLAEKWIALEAEKKQIFEQCINIRNESKASLKELTNHTTTIKAKVQAQIDVLLAKLKTHQELEDKIQSVSESYQAQIGSYVLKMEDCNTLIEQQKAELEEQMKERKEIDDAWAEIDFFTNEIADVSSKVSNLRKEIREIENNIKTIKEVTLVSLEQEKKNAVATKNFRHATTLAAEMKHVEEQIEVQAQLKIAKEEEVKKVHESSSTMAQDLAAARTKIEALEEKSGNSLTSLLDKTPTKELKKGQTKAKDKVNPESPPQQPETSVEKNDTPQEEQRCEEQLEPTTDE